MQIIFATGNAHKLLEAKQILGTNFTLKTPAEYGITEDIPETSGTIRGNALQKARYVFEKTGLPCFSDDTGLEVDALGGAPGVHTARYAGEGKDFNENVDKLLRELSGLPEKDRRARFRCCVALIESDGSEKVFDGTVEGFITEARCGARGFGYDPVFRPEGFDKTFSELSQEEKNTVSHRGRAMRALAAYLKKGKMEKCIIAAVAANGAIGRGNRLLWHISEDLKFFKRTTLGCPVIMGRNTWNSIGRPLPGRLNIVVSARGGFEVPEGVLLVPSLEAAYSACGNIAGGNPSPSRCFVIGGEMLYRTAIEDASRLFITRLEAEAPDADAFFPEIDPAVWKEVSRSAPQRDPETGITFSFVEYCRR